MRIYYAMVLKSDVKTWKENEMHSFTANSFPNKGEMQTQPVWSGKEEGKVTFLGMGYYDFKDEADEEKRWREILDLKTKEYKSKYLPKMDEIRKQCGFPPLKEDS